MGFLYPLNLRTVFLASMMQIHAIIEKKPPNYIVLRWSRIVATKAASCFSATHRNSASKKLCLNQGYALGSIADIERSKLNSQLTLEFKPNVLQDDGTRVISKSFGMVNARKFIRIFEWRCQITSSSMRFEDDGRSVSKNALTNSILDFII